MKNVSVRTRILGAVVAVNLLGTIITMVYLHQSYGGVVEGSAAKAVATSGAAWEVLHQDKATTDLKDSKAGLASLENLKKITSSEYALLIDKQSLDPAAYAKMRDAAGLPNNFDEGDTYAMLATTREEWAEEFQFRPAPGDVAETGKVVGVKNGACSQLCHSGVAGEGDYWGVAWSDEAGVSEVHAVFPVLADGKPVGVLYSIADISDQAGAAKSSMIRTLLMIGATLLIATLTIGGVVDAFVFKRLNRMMLAIEDVSMRVAGGDFTARFEPDDSSDEIGHFEQFFANVLDLMTGTLRSLTDHKKSA